MRRFRRTHHRSGFSTLWLILWAPIFLTLFVFMVEIGNLYLARVELENALEAAALSAVKQWGDAGGGDTGYARSVAKAYAAANCVRGMPLTIDENYDPAADDDNPNQNLTCTLTPRDLDGSGPGGNLIFGAIVRDDPECPITFNAGRRPGCGIGEVLIDATGQGKGNLAADNAWGVVFRDDPDLPDGLTIVSITIDLQGSGGSGRFDFSGGGPVLSDNDPHPVLPCHDDIEGFVDPQHQIVFLPASGEPSQLTILFQPATDPDTGEYDKGFEPGDRFRFGAGVEDVSSGSGADDGDGIGRDGVTVTVVFAIDGVPLPPVSGVFVDNTESSNDCNGSCPVHPSGIEDLPCPPSSAPNNNGQSYLVLSGKGAGEFAVRAQASMQVPSLFCKLFGFEAVPYRVSAKTLAVYSCEDRRPRLMRAERYICPGP
ncbi:hypothetical protein JCM19992_00270 [Thermostilla marina]